jgi:hypothetical protein
MAYSERQPTRLNHLAERGCLSQACRRRTSRSSRLSWAIKSLSADFNLSVLINTYDYSCFGAHLY